MFGRFLPRETSLFEYFEQRAALTIEGTKEFLSLVTTGAARRLLEGPRSCGRPLA